VAGGGGGGASVSMTRFSAGSYRAALRSAGAVCRGVDLVLQGHYASVFCNVLFIDNCRFS